MKFLYYPFTFQYPVQVQRFLPLDCEEGRNQSLLKAVSLYSNESGRVCSADGTNIKKPLFDPSAVFRQGTNKGSFHTKSVDEPVRIKLRSFPRPRRGKDLFFTCFKEDSYHIKGANRFRTLLSARTYHLLLRHSACTTCLHCKRDMRYSSRMLPMAGHRNSQAPHSKCM